MSQRFTSIGAFCALSALPFGWASAQDTAAVQPQSARSQPTLPSQAPSYQPVPQAEAAPAPIVLPPPVWDPRDAEELLAFIQQIGSEGLDPLDYDPATLDAALKTGSAAAISQAATDRFNRVSSDLALGHVKREDRIGWNVSDRDLDSTRQDWLLRTALYQHRVSDRLRELLPTHPQYRDLKNALSITPRTETAKINRIRLNLDRWRWLPRDLGEKYVIVNVPAFYVALVENATTRWRERAVAGAIKTPTPQLSAMATGVILNPWWEVPKSIEPEVRGKKGYVPVKGKDGKVQRWRQPPGPTNALGQMKFVMPNQWAIYLHDTNARSRFNSQVRSLSHGCIRTRKIHDLATELLSDDGGEWTREKIDATLASGESVEAKFVKPVPVYIVYFSSAAATDGHIINYEDVYRRDAKALAALLDTRPAPKKVASK